MTEQEKTIAKIFDKSVEALGIMTKSLCDAIKSTKTDLQTERLYTAEDMEAFAEWTAIMQWIYDPTDKCWFQKHSTETKTTTKLREQWEIETGRKEEADISVKQKCPECGDESYNSDGNYCLNSDCRLFFI